tara:strand:- start:22 stop:612 length:591 start_codon:yes stop_codon:yes gene_type:complete
MNVVIHGEVLQTLYNLQEEKHESNGQIFFDQTGVSEGLKFQKGQVMERCEKACQMNFHTHPSDYVNLFPDHPSTTDYKYVNDAICNESELSSHLIVTPKFVYVIYRTCRSFLHLDKFYFDAAVDAAFSDAKYKFPDRNSESFRNKWAENMDKLGFVTLRSPKRPILEFVIPAKAHSDIRMYVLFFFSLVTLFSVVF